MDLHAIVQRNSTFENSSWPTNIPQHFLFAQKLFNRNGCDAMHIILNWNIYIHIHLLKHILHIWNALKSKQKHWNEHSMWCEMVQVKVQVHLGNKLDFFFLSLHLMVLNHFPICICSWRKAMCMVLCLSMYCQLVMTPYVLDQYQLCQQSSSQLLLSRIFRFCSLLIFRKYCWLPT